MTLEEWDKTPPQAVYEEIKRAAIYTWEHLHEIQGEWVEEEYRKSKLDWIAKLNNHSSSAWAMLQMFHPVLRKYVINNFIEEPARTWAKHAFNEMFNINMTNG